MSMRFGSAGTTLLQSIAYDKHLLLVGITNMGLIASIAAAAHYDNHFAGKR
jgi:hypothetical protein